MDANGMLNTWFGGAASVAPATYYVGLLNGMPTSSTGANLVEPWVPAPAINTITSASTGGSINGSTTRYYVITEVNASGETTGSLEVSYAVPAGTNTNVVTVSWTGSGILGNTFNVYEGSTTGGETLLASGVSTTYYNDTGAGGSGVTYSSSNGGDAGTAGGGGISSTNLFLGNYMGTSRYAFVRFPSVAVSQGASIGVATLSLNYIANGGSGTIDVTVVGDKESNAAEIASLADYNSRPTTTNTVAWSPPNSWSGYTNTPNLAAIVNEILAQSGWASGNALQILIGDNGSPSSVWTRAWGDELVPSDQLPVLTLIGGPPTVNTTGYGYQRVAVAANSTNFPAASGRYITNGTTFTFPTPTGAWGPCVGGVLFDGPQSDANFRGCGYLQNPFTPNVGIVPYLPPNSVNIYFPGALPS
jgi:hypothetical protein